MYTKILTYNTGPISKFRPGFGVLWLEDVFSAVYAYNKYTLIPCSMADCYNQSKLKHPIYKVPVVQAHGILAVH